MKSRSKTVRRVTVLLVLLMVTGAGAGGFYKYRRMRIERRCAAWRADGLAAESRGNYQVAVSDLRQYLHYHADDLTVLVSYIRARPHVDSDAPQSVKETIGALRFLLSLEPQRIEERRQLMDWYTKLHHYTEAAEEGKRLRDQMRGVVPEATRGGSSDYQKVLRELASCEIALKKWKDAISCLDEFIGYNPRDLQAQMDRFGALAEDGMSKQELVAAAEELRRRDPNDPRLALLKAHVLRTAGYSTDPDSKDPETAKYTAKDWAGSVLKRLAADGEFSRILVGE